MKLLGRLARLAGALILFAGWFSPGTETRAAELPNFVVFLTDDQGWGDLGCYGHPIIKSPSIDKFAKEGVRFTQCYSACGVCSPSRSAILTGRTPYRNGVWRWIPAGHPVHLRTSEITIAELLKEKGYATCHAGKWHLNGHFNSPKHPQPNDHGYDHWLATQNNAAPHHMNPTNYVRNGKAVGRMDGPSSLIAVNEAVGWLKRRESPKGPFFITVWTHEPHLPIESAPRFMEPYAHIKEEGIRQHHGNITQLDHAFGVLMKALDDLGHARNTCVFYTSDNGPEGRGTKGRTRGSTGGLRGRKRDDYEGGIRVPGIVRFPAYFEKHGIRPGSVSDVPIIGHDIFTTICHLAGMPLPKDRTIDGANMLPAIAGKPVRREQPLYWRTHIASTDSRVALRIDDWKIVANEDLSRFQLFNLKDDWKETTNLDGKYPDKLAELKKKLIEHDAAVKAEGPDWWKHEPPRRNRQGGRGGRRRSGPLLDGKDETGQFVVVKGATVTKSELGYRLACGGEGFALRKLAKPLKGKATFRLRYRSTRKSGTRNAALAIGATPAHQHLLKIGTAIGMGSHVAFQGGWNNVDGSGRRAAKLTPTFELTVEIDLEKRRCLAKVSGEEFEVKLPADLKEIAYYGVYAKGTTSDFSKVEVEAP